MTVRVRLQGCYFAILHITCTTQSNYTKRLRVSCRGRGKGGVCCMTHIHLSASPRTPSCALPWIQTTDPSHSHLPTLTSSLESIRVVANTLDSMAKVPPCHATSQHIPPWYITPLPLPYRAMAKSRAMDKSCTALPRARCSASLPNSGSVPELC